MFVLVLIAYIIGDDPVIRASPHLYNTYTACELSAVDVMNEVYEKLTRERQENIRLLYMCEPIPTEA